MLDFIFSLVLLVALGAFIFIAIKDWKDEKDFLERFRQQSLLLLNTQITNEIKRTALLERQFKNLGKED